MMLVFSIRQSTQKGILSKLAVSNFMSWNTTFRDFTQGWPSILCHIQGYVLLSKNTIFYLKKLDWIAQLTCPQRELFKTLCIPPSETILDTKSWLET